MKSLKAVRFACRQVLSETVGDDASASRKTQGKYNSDTLYEVTSIVNFVDTFPKGESKPQREKQENFERRERSYTLKTFRVFCLFLPLPLSSTSPPLSQKGKARKFERRERSYTLKASRKNSKTQNINNLITLLSPSGKVAA